jgi:CheY-like chemotaxis protein
MIRDRILVIDDDRDFRELACIILEASGLVGLQAGSCGEALPILDRERARLRAVLLDYFMPGPPPRECARAVLAAVDPGVPVILVSAAVDIAERATELGLTRSLAKPFEMPQLLDAVMQAAA